MWSKFEIVYSINKILLQLLIYLWYRLKLFSLRSSWIIYFDLNSPEIGCINFCCTIRSLMKYISMNKQNFQRYIKRCSIWNYINQDITASWNYVEFYKSTTFHVLSSLFMFLLLSLNFCNLSVIQSPQKKCLHYLFCITTVIYTCFTFHICSDIYH